MIMVFFVFSTSKTELTHEVRIRRPWAISLVSTTALTHAHSQSIGPGSHDDRDEGLAVSNDNEDEEDDPLPRILATSFVCGT